MRVTINPAALERLVLSRAVVEHVARKAGEVAVAASHLCPHRSGRLAASIQVERLSSPLPAFSIGSRLPYARISENRSPYLLPALQVAR